MKYLTDSDGNVWKREDNDSESTVFVVLGLGFIALTVIALIATILFVNSPGLFFVYYLFPNLSLFWAWTISLLISGALFGILSGSMGGIGMFLYFTGCGILTYIAFNNGGLEHVKAMGDILFPFLV